MPASGAFRSTEVSEYPNFFKLLEKLQTLDKPLVGYTGHAWVMLGVGGNRNYGLRAGAIFQSRIDPSKLSFSSFCRRKLQSSSA